jgi:hypothetical protein
MTAIVSSLEAGTAINYQAIYSMHQSEASSFPHAGVSDAFLDAASQATMGTVAA